MSVQCISIDRSRTYYSARRQSPNIALVTRILSLFLLFSFLLLFVFFTFSLSLPLSFFHFYHSLPFSLLPVPLSAFLLLSPFNHSLSLPFVFSPGEGATPERSPWMKWASDASSNYIVTFINYRKFLSTSSKSRSKLTRDLFCKMRTAFRDPARTSFLYYGKIHTFLIDERAKMTCHRSRIKFYFYCYFKFTLCFLCEFFAWVVLFHEIYIGDTSAREKLQCTV